MGEQEGGTTTEGVTGRDKRVGGLHIHHSIDSESSSRITGKNVSGNLGREYGGGVSKESKRGKVPSKGGHKFDLRSERVDLNVDSSFG